MNKTVLAIILAGIASGLAINAATAADIPGGGPRPYYQAAPSAYYNWGGFYGGVNLGYQWGEVSNTSTEPSGLMGGLQAGYNWQNGQFVFGGETDLNLTGADDTFAPYKFSNPWWGSLRARAGMAWNNILLYATGGLAYGSVKGESFLLSETKTSLGWTLGAGVEMGFAPNWSAKIEYLYMDLASRSYSITGTDNGLSSSVVRVGVNYHFAPF
jgi:outer membrane immunogenic protein